MALIGLILLTLLAGQLIPDARQAWYLSVWASSGLFVFVLMRKGYALVPGLWLGALMGNCLLGYDILSAFAFATGELLGAWIALRLMYRWVPDWRSLTFKADFLWFLLFPCLLNGILVGIWGIFWQRLFYPEPWPDVPVLFLSNASAVSFGVLLLSSNLLSWQKPWSWKSLITEDRDFWLFSVYVLVATTWLFWQHDPDFLGIIGLLFVLFIPMLWALTRFPVDAVYRLALLVFLLAMAATARDLGPYSGATALHPITVLQIIGIGMISIGLFAAAMIAGSSSFQVGSLRSSLPRIR
ncbi:hypothetical protein B1757_07170 [Acidithiobacillus marinus]|uniref:MASE1 domain-containing protein n=1 Tax=Acidithiobacillus marinus TaxID=187490 RepID=A0A2I1DM44_9PROT|nr:hypothetical protein B1757_07170 [Acidithiobacillus marinus]